MEKEEEEEEEEDEETGCMSEGKGSRGGEVDCGVDGGSGVMVDEEREKVGEGDV